MHRLFVGHSSREGFGQSVPISMGGHWNVIHPGVTANRKNNAMSHWLCLLPATPSPLFFSTDSFVVLIHHGKGRRNEITVFKLACTVRVIAPEGMNSDHLWLLMKEKMLHSEITHVHSPDLAELVSFYSLPVWKGKPFKTMCIRFKRIIHYHYHLH